jgi:hypothetical protein
MLIADGAGQISASPSVLSYRLAFGSGVYLRWHPNSSFGQSSLPQYTMLR